MACFFKNCPACAGMTAFRLGAFGFAQDSGRLKAWFRRSQNLLRGVYSMSAHMRGRNLRLVLSAKSQRQETLPPWMRGV